MSQHSNNSVADLIPLVAEAMKDKQWRCLSDLIMDVGEHIMPERAARFYTGQMGTQNAGVEKRPLDERIRQGRRRGIYLCLKAMAKRGMIEARNEQDKTDDREYRLVVEISELSKRRARRPKTRPVDGLGSMVEMVDDLEKEFSKRFPGSRDQGDFRFHARHIRRIIMIHELGEKPLPLSDAKEMVEKAIV